MRPDAYCGLYCGACEVMAAHRKGTVAQVAQEWGRSEEDLRCDGCKTEVTAVYCRDCTFRACARGKGVEFCSECANYPCDALIAFRDDTSPHHSIVVHNLDRIAGIGGRAWCEEQRARWSCPACGEPFSWYADACPSCGGDVRSAIQEERELDIS